MWEDGVDCFALLGPELERRGQLQRAPGDALVIDLDLAPGLLDEPRGRVEQAARQDELVIERLVIGGDDARDVPGRLAAALAVVEIGVVGGRRVLERRVQGGRQLRARDPHRPLELEVHDGRRARLCPG